MHPSGVDPRYVQYQGQYGPTHHGAHGRLHGVDPRANYAPNTPQGSVASQPDPRMGGGGYANGHGGYGAATAPGSSGPYSTGGEAGAYSATRQGVWTAGGHYSGATPSAPTNSSSQVRAQKPRAQNPMMIAQPQLATRKEQSLQSLRDPSELRVYVVAVGRTSESEESWWGGT
jgi:hypothetical protein